MFIFFVDIKADIFLPTKAIEFILGIMYKLCEFTKGKWIHF